MIYKTVPEIFNLRYEVVSCQIEYDKKIILFLLRKQTKTEGGKWGLPAGKINPGEDKLTAIQREVKEETGLLIEKSEFQYLTTVYVKYPEYDFVYHMFKTELAKIQPIIIEPREHDEYQWVDVEKALTMNLVRDLDQCLRLTL